MNWLKRPFDFESGAILNFHKPKGRSSFWVVKQIKKLVAVKVGHSGTLDPFAEGVLLLCTGRATKKVAELMDLPKTYIGEIELGFTTDTDDVTGNMLTKSSVQETRIEEIERVCKSFIGDIYQLLPMFSAKKIKGRRLYKLARAGETIDREPSLVHIESLDLLSFKLPIIKIKVQCSKGTYIRSLARDIGEKIGCGGYLKSLVRTKIGAYKIEDSLTLEKFDQILRSANVVSDEIIDK